MADHCRPIGVQSRWPRALLIAALALGATAAYAEDILGLKQHFEIAPGSLETALIEFSRQAHVQIMMDAKALSGYQTSGVQGTEEARTALSKLLHESGLTYTVVGNAVRIRRASTTDGRELGRPNSMISSAQLDSKVQETVSGDANVTDEVSRPRKVLDEIIVTGTHIRYYENRTSPRLTYDRNVLDATGYATTQEFVATLPQNFGGGILGSGEDGRLGAGRLAQNNYDLATGVNLRGLGESATLVLLNGKRMAPSALGSIVDTSVIPLAAIDRVDVITDGASAVYGADAVAGVVNFVLRRDFEGADTSLRYARAGRGSLSEWSAAQTLGRKWATGNALAYFQYRNQDALSSSERPFTSAAPQPTDILPKLSQYSALLSARQEVSDRLELTVDALVVRKENRAATFFNPTSGNDSERQSRATNLQGSIGYSPFGEWRLDLSGNFARQETDLSYVALGRPLPNYTLGTLAITSEATLSGGDVTFTGPLFSLPAGEVRAAIGSAYRKENFDIQTRYSGSSIAQDRRVQAAFAELYVPLVGSGSAIPYLNRLELSLAVRRDDYSDFGGTTNPKVGVYWSPTEAIGVRGSWGRSFRAPNAGELVQTSSGQVMFNALFSSPNGSTVPVFIRSGAGAPLQPERAKSWTLGFDLQPPAIAGLKASFSYFNVDFSDRIVTPGADPSALLRPDVYGSLIVPVANDSSSASFLDAFVGEGGRFFDLLQTGSEGVRYIFLAHTQNAAIVRQSGYDITLGYAFKLGTSAVAASANIAVINEIDTAFTESSTPVDISNTYANPLRLRARGDLSWQRKAWRLNLAMNYYNSYTDTSVSPPNGIGSWTTVDTSLKYTPHSSHPIWSNISLGLNVSNLFDSEPPFVAGGIGRVPGIHYDVGIANPRGRFMSLDVRYTW